ncbi:YcbK family protein [Agrobacterium tumefaciens]|uniref:YcbK family protein n=1 Tax=Agrobacterium tumefaciens TaxID=358 RepID=UPI00287E29B5|nr:YcbK family protein [Agrobacterium tumefaciens]MDS7597279.1 YcbK family protein [Agrobacterium tumefaciens]
MKTVGGNRGRGSCQRLVVAVSLLGLSGCVSAVTDDEMAADVKKTEVVAEQKVATANGSPATQPQGRYVDPAMVSAAGAGGAATETGAQAPQPQQSAQGQVYGAPADIGGLVTQPTGISAGTASIYSTAPAATAASAAVPTGAGVQPSAAAVPAQKIVPSVSSVYSAPQQVQEQMPVVAEQHSQNIQVAPVPQPAPANMAAAVPVAPSTGNSKPGETGDTVTMAAFFAGAAKKRLPKALESGASEGREVAALPNADVNTMGIALSGRAVMSDEFDDAHLDEEDDEPTGLMKLASLSGLTRVAPNGLFLQTGHVEVGCFKPELVKVIKDVEAHYNSPAIITSGYRPPKGVRRGSKHYTCDAADIQIKGVSKWELATYLRSLPNRGGVGTYCHTESVHLDTGEPRDWNWRCRRTAARK